MESKMQKWQEQIEEAQEFEHLHLAIDENNSIEVVVLEPSEVIYRQNLGGFNGDWTLGNAEDAVGAAMELSETFEQLAHDAQLLEAEEAVVAAEAALAAEEELESAAQGYERTAARCRVERAKERLARSITRYEELRSATADHSDWYLIRSQRKVKHAP